MKSPFLTTPLAVVTLLVVGLLSACVAVHPVVTTGAAATVAATSQAPVETPASPETAVPTETSAPTETPAPTEAATAASTTGENVPLFQDDFSDPASGWISQTMANGDFAYVDGAYRIRLNKDDFNIFSLLPKRTFDNVAVEADVT